MVISKHFISGVYRIEFYSAHYASSPQHIFGFFSHRDNSQCFMILVRERLYDFVLIYLAAYCFYKLTVSFSAADGSTTPRQK